MSHDHPGGDDGSNEELSEMLDLIGRLPQRSPDELRRWLAEIKRRASTDEQITLEPADSRAGCPKPDEADLWSRTWSAADVQVQSAWHTPMLGDLELQDENELVDLRATPLALGARICADADVYAAATRREAEEYARATIAKANAYEDAALEAAARRQRQARLEAEEILATARREADAITAAARQTVSMGPTGSTDRRGAPPASANMGEHIFSLDNRLHLWLTEVSRGPAFADPLGAPPIALTAAVGDMPQAVDWMRDGDLEQRIDSRRASMEVDFDGDEVRVCRTGAYQSVVGVVIVFSRDEWNAFLRAVKDGEFDRLPAVPALGSRSCHGEMASGEDPCAIAEVDGGMPVPENPGGKVFVVRWFNPGDPARRRYSTSEVSYEAAGVRVLALDDRDHACIDGYFGDVADETFDDDSARSNRH